VAGREGDRLAAAVTLCKSRRCKGGVWWVKTPLGARMVHLPLDPDPVPNGHLVRDRRPSDGQPVWRPYRPGRDNAKKRFSVHWDGLCKDRAAWSGERAAAGSLGVLADMRSGDVWGTAFGPCCGCGTSTRLYGEHASTLCGDCQDILAKWRAQLAEGTAPPGGPPYPGV
jgi:hypothetical protein